MSSLAGAGTCTCNVLTFVGTAAIACGQKISRSFRILVDAIAVVFTNVRTLRVLVYYSNIRLS